MKVGENTGPAAHRGGSGATCVLDGGVMSQWMNRLGGAVVGGVVLVSVAAAQSPSVPPDYGLDWVTIGAPGNRPVNETKHPD